MYYKVTCRNLDGDIRQTDEFKHKEHAEFWANAVNKVGYWQAEITEEPGELDVDRREVPIVYEGK